METSNATSIKPPSHGTVRLLTGVAVVFIAICGGVLLGIASVTGLTLTPSSLLSPVF